MMHGPSKPPRGGRWATSASNALTLPHYTRLTDGLRTTLKTRNTRPIYKEFLAVIREFEKRDGYERLALCILQTALQSIGANKNYTKTAKAIGLAIGWECRAAGLTTPD